MENWTYTTNLPHCANITSTRPIQVGEIISALSRDENASVPFVFALVTSKINGRLTLKPVKFTNCWIETDSYATPSNQDSGWAQTG